MLIVYCLCLVQLETEYFLKNIFLLLFHIVYIVIYLQSDGRLKMSKKNIMYVCMYKMLDRSSLVLESN